MKEYKHTQIGYLMIVVTFITALFFGWLSLIIPLDESSTFINIIMVSTILILLSFSTLQTVVDDNYLRIKFGFGIFKKCFLLEDIVSIKIVKNRWYYGWGIRVWFWPYMWIYNVSGFDAVELVMKSGKIYRIGTDVPEQLAEAITSRSHI